MTKDEMKAYWNYSRIVRTIPEKDYNKPEIQKFMLTYGYLETQFFKTMQEMNERRVDEKGQL